MKKIHIVVLTLCLIFANVIPVFAEENTTHKVIDEGQVMTDVEKEQLTEKIEGLIGKYQIDIVVATETQKSASTIQDEADLMFEDRGYGLGSTKDGILFLVSINDREWAISTSGNAIGMFSDYDLSSMGEAVAANYFADGYYADGFEDYLGRLDRKLDAGVNQGQQGVGNSTGNTPRIEVQEVVTEEAEEPWGAAAYIIPAMIVGLVITIVYMNSMKRTMNTATGQLDALGYQKGNADAQIRREDIFLTSSISRRPIEKNDNQGSQTASHHRATVHRSSSGGRHGGASGKF